MPASSPNNPRPTQSISVDDLPVGLGAGKIASGQVAEISNNALSVAATCIVLPVATVVALPPAHTQVFALALHDMAGNVVPRTQRLKVNVRDGAMLQTLAAAITIAETGTGTEISTTAKPTLLLDTSSIGAAQITITDVGGAGFTGFLEVTAEAASGQPGLQCCVAVTIA